MEEPIKLSSPLHGAGPWKLSLIGYWMAQLMTEMFSSDLFRLPFAPSRASYGWAIVIVMIAAAATAALVALRVLRLDMVAVLKARD